MKINLMNETKGRYNLTLDIMSKLENPPLYNKRIILNKDIDNKIDFCITDMDRQVISVRNTDLFLILVSKNLTKKYVKEIKPVNESRGYFQTIIKKEELEDFEIGALNGYVISKQIDNFETLLRTGCGYDVKLDMYVTGNTVEIEVPSVELTTNNWRYSESEIELPYNLQNSYMSSEILSNANSVHTMGFKIRDFKGYIEVFGTLDDDEHQSMRNWFKIFDITCGKMPEDSEESFDLDKCEPISENISKTFEMKLWSIKILYAPHTDNHGSIEKIWYRN